LSLSERDASWFSQAAYGSMFQNATFVAIKLSEEALL